MYVLVFGVSSEQPKIEVECKDKCLRRGEVRKEGGLMYKEGFGFGRKEDMYEVLSFFNFRISVYALVLFGVRSKLPRRWGSKV